ncbi:restriction endonuclease subunit S [Aquirufa nivalisilvae]
MEKFKDIFLFAPKSKIKAGEGLDEGRFPFYTSSAIQNKWIDTEQHFDEALIFGTGGSASIHYESQPFSTSTDCFVTITTRRDVNTKYVYYFLSSNIHLLERGFKGVGLKHLSKTYLEKIEIPLPEIEAQNKIVAILDKAKTILDKRKETIKKYDELLRATFWLFFEKHQGLNIHPLILVAEIASGLTKGKKYSGKSTRLVPYMRVANVQDGYLALDDIKDIEATEEEISRYKLEVNDLLLTEGGDPDKLGRGTLWKNQIKECIFQNHIFRVRIRDKYIINPDFLAFQVSSLYGKNYFLKAAKQTSGIASINSTQLKAFPVYLPPIELQNKFSKVVVKIESLKAKLNQLKQKASLLLESISDSAFNQGLEFNTAVDLEVLLENDYDFFKENSNSSSIKLLIERLNTDELNENRFSEQQTYNKAKSFVFELIKEGKVKQVFDEKSKNIKLTL